MCVLLQQIYNEMIRDLLNPSSGFLELREDSKGVVVAGISEVQAKKTSEVNIDCSHTCILVNLRFHVQGLIFLKYEFYGELEININLALTIIFSISTIYLLFPLFLTVVFNFFPLL